jgi:predicted alpha-1,6-mannanase (GH76 family)
LFVGVGELFDRFTFIFTKLQVTLYALLLIPDITLFVSGLLYNILILYLHSISPIMYIPSLSKALLLSTPLFSNAFAQSITDPTQRAEFALSALQIWYNAGNGLWDGAGWWNSANAMTMLANLVKVDSNPQLKDLATRIFANTLKQAPVKNPQPGVESKPAPKRDLIDTDTAFVTGYDKGMGDDDEPITTFPSGWGVSTGEYFDVKIAAAAAADPKTKNKATAAAPNANDWLDGFYDDDLWWALAWINAYDVTKNAQYLTLAEGIFKGVTKAWGTKCGNGGIWWSWKKTYANAIANELFLSTAAHLANRVAADQKGYYVDWAQKEIKWFQASGMINARGTINDGLGDNCKNNNRVSHLFFSIDEVRSMLTKNQTTWSYNQGVILSGLVELNRAAPDASYLPLASKIAKAAIIELSDKKGVIHDKCGPICGGDASQFKGIFARGLQDLQAAAPDDAIKNCIKTNADSVWNNNRNDGNLLSINWAGPFVASANATTHSSSMDVLVAAVAVSK